MLDWSIGLGPQFHNADPHIPLYLKELCYDSSASHFGSCLDEIFISPTHCLCAQIPGVYPVSIEYLDFYLMSPPDTGLIIDFMKVTQELIDDLQLLNNKILPLYMVGQHSKVIKLLNHFLNPIFAQIHAVEGILNNVLYSSQTEYPHTFMQAVTASGSLMKCITHLVGFFLTNEPDMNNFSVSESSKYYDELEFRTLIDVTKAPITWLRRTMAIINQCRPDIYDDNEQLMLHKYVEYAKTIIVSLESLPRLEEISLQFVVEPFPIIQSARRVLKEGDAMKQCRKKADARHLILFSDYFMYVQVIQGKYYAPGFYELIRLRVSQIDLNGRIGLTCYAPKKSFILLFPSVGERDEWFNAVSQAIDFVRESSPTPNEPYWEAPVWIPDEFTNNCMSCGAEFSIFNRKHHCRSCGKVMCADCTATKIMLPCISCKKPVRVCTCCLETAKSRAEIT